MKLSKRDADAIANKCAVALLTSIGEEQLTRIPYDALCSEMSEMIEDIEDKVSSLLSAQLEEKDGQKISVEELWE